jgi:hypothetical protein
MSNPNSGNTTSGVSIRAPLLCAELRRTEGVGEMPPIAFPTARVDEIPTAIIEQSFLTTLRLHDRAIKKKHFKTWKYGMGLWVRPCTAGEIVPFKVTEARMYAAEFEALLYNPPELPA